MKRIMLSLLVLWAVWALAVVPADYYMPLQVGNCLVYREDDELTGTGGWSSRTVYETIEGTDSLHGHLYFKQVGTEFLDEHPDSELIRHVFWFREDSVGNILIGATGMGNSRLLDSAVIYPMEYTMFFPEKYEPGYGMQSYYENMDCLDSTISNTETVSTNVGIYHNCIKMMSERVDTSSDSLVWQNYVYYAENVGEIKKERIFPDPHISILHQINFQTDIDGDATATFCLEQNYPNPFNPLTTIEYELPLEAYVSIVIYDITGNEITSLVNMNRNAGRHKVIWNAEDVASGIYIYILKINYLVRETRKMCILK